jgi:hypothetical protein
MNNELAPPRGVYPYIYSLVGCACAAGSNQRNQGLRRIKRGGGGTFQKGGCNPNPRAPPGPMVGPGPASPTWRRPSPPLLQVSSRWFLNLPVIFPVADKFHVYFALESLFSAFLK